jgi:hypothetical protein
MLMERKMEEENIFGETGRCTMEHGLLTKLKDKESIHG